MQGGRRIVTNYAEAKVLEANYKQVVILLSNCARPEHFEQIPGNRFAFESLGKNPQLGQVSLSSVDVYPCHTLGEDLYIKSEFFSP